MPRFFNLPSRCRNSFIPVFSQTFTEIEDQQAYSRRKEYFHPFYVAQVIIVRGFISFFIFNDIGLFSFCTQIFLFTGWEVENDKCRQWLQNNCFFACKQFWSWIWPKEASKTNPYVQFSVFSNDLLSLICFSEWRPSHGRVMKKA